MKLNARKDVPVNETWDLSLIFAAEADFEAAVEKAKALADTLEKTYKNALTTPESIAECLALYEELEILLYQTTSYTSLAVSVDYTDTEAQKKDAKMTALAAEIGRLEKSADELRPWGEFSPERTKALASQGIVLRYFFTPKSNYDKFGPEWSERYTLSLINRTDSTAYFVAVTAPGEDVTLDAQEMKAPSMDFREAERRIAEAGQELRALDAEFSRVAASEKLLAAHAAQLKERLQGVRVKATAQQAADGTLVVMEGWAEKETSDKVDALLEAYPNIVYLKGDPTPEDDTPVKLKNNRFARVFELVGDMYARPKYGTMDLTPFFAPFYVLFFGICLNDAGYGAILALLGAWMLSKNRKPGMMRQAAWFATLCGMVPVDPFLRFPGPVLLDRAGHRPRADHVRHGAQDRHDLLHCRVPLFARFAGVAAGHFGREPCSRTADAQLRVGDPVLHHLLARVLCDARHGCGADAVLQFAGQEPAAEFRAGIVGYL